MNLDRRFLRQSGSSALRQGLLEQNMQVQRHAAGTLESIPGAAEYTTFREFGSLLRRNKGVFGLFLLGGAALAALLAFSQTPMYQAKALIEVEMPNEDFLNRRQLNPVAAPGMLVLEPFLQTQVRLIESDTMLLSIIDKLQLVKHREFNSAPGLVKRIKQRIVNKAPEAATNRSVLAIFREHLSVRLFGQTQIVEIMYDASDPQLAAEVVNALAEACRAQALQRMVGSATQTEQLLAGQIEEQKTSLIDAENKLREFVSTNGLMVATTDKESFADSQLRQVQSALGMAHDTRVATESQYEMVRTASPDALGKTLDSDTLRSYRVKLAELKQQLAENSEVLKPAHYKVRQIQAEIDALQHDFEQERAGILARLKSQYEAAIFREDSLTRDYDHQSRTVAVQMGKSVQYNELKHDLEARRALYDSTLRQVKEATVISAMQASNVHLVDPAVAPDLPIRPNKMLYSAIGLASGSLFGLVFIFTTDRRKNGRVSAPPPRIIEHNVRQLGTIPLTSTLPEEPGVALGAPDGCCEAAVWHGLDAAAESFRKILPHLLYSSQRSARPRVISVTSTTHGEGRTFVASNLAAVVAQSGRKVLLVDGDRINPRVHEIFGVSNESGFTELLLQQPGRTGGPSTDTVWSTGIPNLFVSPIGSGMARLATLTHDPRLPAVLDRLCGHFDLILIDTPPIFSDGDALALGQQSDGVLLVVRPGQASAELFEASVEQCLQHGLPVVGKIVNGSQTNLQELVSQDD
jgi:succinoglycan biosynthesis transport protein ExoP